MTDALPADIAFVLAALRRDADAPRALRSASAGVNDWMAVAQLALAHDVGWWVMRALPSEGVPAAARAALGDAVRRVALGALSGARQLAELHRLLDADGVRAVAYKGPALAVDVHGDIGARYFTDLDLLIAESDRDRALAVLRAAGYASPTGQTPREERVYSRWEGVTQLAHGDDWPVELHWRCQAPRYGGPQDPASLVTRSLPCSLGGGSVRVPSPEDLGVLLALHGVKHAWSSLLWVADLAAAVSRPAFDWQKFTALADGWHVRRAMHYALLVVRELVACDIPPGLLQAARRDARAAYLAHAISLRLGGRADAPDIGHESSPRYDLQWLDGTWGRARYLALALVLPTTADRRAIPLPDALLPLAYPARAFRLMRRALVWTGIRRHDPRWRA